MEEKKKEINRYKCQKLLGEGSFGKAFLVSCKDESLAVVKTIFLNGMSDDQLKEAFLESKILERLDHPNIIKFREVYLTNNPKLTMCLVMDYADGGDLQSKIKSQKGKSQFTESQILDWFTQICLAIKHIHDRKILHRDLKSQNVFLTERGEIKLGDFGIAKCLKNTIEVAKTVVGTPYYFSPEIIQNKPYSFKSDIWSLGILLYEMCALKMPFDGSNLASLSIKIIKGNYTPLPTSFTRDIRGLISSLLHVDMNKRPSINEILRNSLIKHRIKNFLSESDYEREFSYNDDLKIKMMKNTEKIFKNDNKSSVNIINDGKKSLSNFYNEYKKQKFLSAPINVDKKIEINKQINNENNNKQENKQNNENVNVNEKKLENKIVNSFVNDKKNENIGSINNNGSNAKISDKMINNLVNNIDKPNIVLTNNIVSELKKSLESKLSNFTNQLNKNDHQDKPSNNINKPEILKLNKNIDAYEYKQSPKRCNEFNIKVNHQLKEDKKTEESNLKNKSKSPEKERKGIVKKKDDVIQRIQSNYRAKEDKKTEEINKRKSPEKERKGNVKKKEDVSQQIQPSYKAEEKNKICSQKPLVNRLQNLNPNFLIKKVADGESKKDIEVEIYEPKKKQVFNPDAYKIIRSSPENNRKDNVSDKSKYSDNHITKSNLHQIDKNTNEVSNTNIDDKPKKESVQLKKFLKEMREKKKKNENDIDQSIVIKWAEPKKKDPFEPENLDNKNEEDIKEIEEEKNLTFKKYGLQTISERKLSPEFSVKNETKENFFFETQNINNFTLKNTTISEFKEESINNCDYSKLEAYKIALENELGDFIFASIYRKIDNVVDENQLSYDHNLLDKLREELFELEDEKIDLCLKRVPDIFDLVIKERTVTFNANK